MINLYYKIIINEGETLYINGYKENYIYNFIYNYKNKKMKIVLNKLLHIPIKKMILNLK